MASKRKSQAPSYTPERGAEILAYCDAFGIAKTCDRYSITDQTLRNYRKRLKTDDQLLEIYSELKQQYVDELHADIVATIRVVLSEIRRRSQSATDADDAKCLTAIAAAFQTVADYKFTSSALAEPADVDSGV